VVVRFVNIGGIVVHHCFNFLFIIWNWMSIEKK